MEAKELRIGNLIFNGIGEVFKVNGETISNFHAGQAALGAFKPIELTEEWLIKFGFNKKDGDFWISSSKNHIIQISYEDIVSCFAMVYNGMQYCKIEQVHKLQNLYFALTGEELTLPMD